MISCMRVVDGEVRGEARESIGNCERRTARQIEGPAN
jgi:hypothetical protein